MTSFIPYRVVISRQTLLSAVIIPAGTVVYTGLYTID